jgi:hypothetical protein
MTVRHSRPVLDAQQATHRELPDELISQNDNSRPGQRPDLL